MPGMKECRIVVFLVLQERKAHMMRHQRVFQFFEQSRIAYR